ncbi:MAG: gspD [Rhizobacter sp.]|nr:gspD [Rhizobacter sp.]
MTVRHHPTYRGTAPRRSTAATAARWLCLTLALTIALPPAALAQTTAPGANRARAPITLNFVNADIEGVSRAMGVILDRQILVDPRVKGTITLYSDTPLAPRDAYLNYLAALRGLGFAVVDSNGLLKVVPEADAKLQAGTVALGGPVGRQGDQIITQVFRLSQENANNLVPVLRPLISPNNTINANPGNNTLVITDYADNLVRLGKIIAAMDTAGSTDVEVIQLQYAVAADLAVMVQRLTDGSASGGAINVQAQPGGGVGANSGNGSVMVDSRTNSLLIRAQTPARLAQLKSLIAKLDRPGVGGVSGSNIYVVYLRNADAVRLAQVLRAAFAADQSRNGGQNAGGGAGGSSGGANTLNTSALNSALANSGGSSSGTGSSAQATAPVNSAAAPSTGGFIQADPATNSLVITAVEPLYRQLRAVIDQLDTRRAQVYVESLIVEVDATRAADLGIQWQGIIGSSGDSTVVGLGTNFGAGTNNILGATQLLAQGATAIGTAALPSAGFNIGVANKFGNRYTLGLLARALASTTGTNILSTPNLVTLDNEEAKIVVGQNVPFITGSTLTTSLGTTSPYQTIERKDVGITLRIRPQIGEDGTVRMVIFQESSSVAAVAAVGTSNAGPTTNKRSIESTVVVNDGQIIVLGGLIDDNYTIDRSKVPLLGDIPYLGGLFRSESRTRNKNNLMVFLRPVVMRDENTSNRISLDRYDYIRSQQQAAQPIPSALLGNINDSPVLPPIRPEPIGSPNVPRPLGETGTGMPFAPVVPSVPADTPPGTLLPTTPVLPQQQSQQPSQPPLPIQPAMLQPSIVPGQPMAVVTVPPIDAVAAAQLAAAATSNADPLPSQTRAQQIAEAMAQMNLRPPTVAVPAASAPTNPAPGTLPGVTYYGTKAPDARP